MSLKNHFRLYSQKPLKLQILSSHFRWLQIRGNWKFASVIDGIDSSKEDNAATTAASREEADLQRNKLERRMEAAASDLDIQMKAVAEAAKIAKRGIKEASEEAWVKAAASKATAFLSVLVGVCTYRCTMF